jgi:hypothetical protein
MVMRRCNHCNGQLGLIVHRKWMLRFCSKSCKKAYEHKLQEERRAKLRHLEFLAPGEHTSSWAELVRQYRHKLNGLAHTG